MRKVTKMREKMARDLPFADVWANTDHPDCELGYIRAYHDGYTWCNSVFSTNSELWTPGFEREINAVYAGFTTAFKDRYAMSSWCSKNATRIADDEYVAYFVGELGCYKFRMITRRGDYNLYLYCLSKAAM